MWYRSAWLVELGCCVRCSACGGGGLFRCGGGSVVAFSCLLQHCWFGVAWCHAASCLAGVLNVQRLPGVVCVVVLILLAWHGLRMFVRSVWGGFGGVSVCEQLEGAARWASRGLRSCGICFAVRCANIRLCVVACLRMLCQATVHWSAYAPMCGPCVLWRIVWVLFGAVCCPL